MPLNDPPLLLLPLPDDVVPARPTPEAPAVIGPLTTLIARVRATGYTLGLRTAKATLAVVAAYLIAELLHLSEHPIVAPLTALLVVQLTLFQTLAHEPGRVVGVLAGVVVAVLVPTPG